MIFCVFTAPEGMISNVTVVVVSSTSVIVQWSPVDPSLWNGIITSYTVLYQSTSVSNTTLAASIPSLPEHPLANNPDPRLVSSPLEEESIRLEGLEENYVYQFTVYYENSAGRSVASQSVQIEIPPSGICYSLWLHLHQLLLSILV